MYTVQAITILSCEDQLDKLSDDVAEGQLDKLSDDVAETKKMCSALLDRQASFERLVTAQLAEMKSYLEDLILMAPPPFSSMPAKLPSSSTPKSVRPSKDDEHNTDMAEDMGAFTEPTPMKEISNLTLPGDLEAAKLSSLRATSCSRENFASKLVKELYTNDDRLTCNVRGVAGKDKFDEKKMTYIQDLTFKNYPCTLAERKTAWGKCIKAIDSASRALCRAKGKENYM